jgi:hypothetical protein
MNQGSYPMSIDTNVLVFIAAGFGVFAAALYWADLQARGVGK